MTFPTAVRERVLDLYAADLSRREIARRTGLLNHDQVGGIVAYARRLGDARAAFRPRLAGREGAPVTLTITDAASIGALESEAARRGVSAARLAKRVIATIAAEGLIGAVLDDAAEGESRS
ncbi:hypothetical protein [Afifella sp. IM 167]|uniref:hypothetical protein n=1 Tax=Afifella sp. IM 167 TaxID=2033586 RepID=UPI001CCE8D79|nr:hypothetical protein [Afifella sp. IM 167]MBZ8133256.1 hypothetical protein [Afifella sp. IM 167]